MSKVVYPWEGAFDAFKIFGNLYFTGTVPASTHVIKTTEGLILLDPGYQHSLYLVIDSMYRMGLELKDLKYILITHGHIDHFGGARALKEMTGAKIAIGEADRDYANGKLDLSWAKELGLEYNETFEPDILLNDGDIITLGDTKVRAAATPGHTPGAMTYIFDVTDGEKTYTAGLCGGIGANSMQKDFLDKYNLSYDCRPIFIDAMERLKKEKIDIYLGNHMYQSNTAEKYKKLCAGDENAFIDPTEWAKAMEEAKQRIIKMVEEE